MSASRPHGPEGGLPEHEARAWDAIVADLSGQIDLGPQFPREQSLPPLAATGDHPDPLADPVEWEDEDAEGYEPPPPPPLPRPSGTRARFAWAAVAGGPALAVISTLLGWETWLAGLGVAATIAGFVVLIASRQDRDDDLDNGAVI